MTQTGDLLGLLVDLKCFIHERKILFLPDSKDQAWPEDTDLRFIFAMLWPDSGTTVMLLAV